MTKKLLFRYTSTLLRTALLLGVMILVSAQTKAQIANVTTGVIASQGDVATYYSILDNYPVDISSMVPDIVSSWSGDNASLSSEHWDGSGTSNYYDRWNGTAINPSTHYKNTTIYLPRGRYAVLSAARASTGVTLSLKVNDNEMTMPGQGNSAKGITTSGEASFEGGTYANNGNGYGWRYFYIQFEVTADNTPVELRVSGSSSGEGWMSFTTPRLLTAFNASTDIECRVEKAFTLNEDVWLQNDREFTVQFYFDPVADGVETWTLCLYNNGQQVASLPIEHGGGSGREGYWHNYDKFHDHVLNWNFNGNGLSNYYVRWYLKDKSGNFKNINNALRNESNIYQKTGGMVWSSRMGDSETDLHNILRMTVDGTPDGGTPFDLRDYDLVCVISEAGNESVINNTASGDASPINIEYTFHFENRQLGIPLTDKKVTHKVSYLKQYADQYSDLGLDLESQGLTTDAESDWWDHENKTQRVNQFEITHYLKQGTTEIYLLPTAQDTNDHTMYQRWYNYNDETDLQSILDRVTLIGNGGSVPYYLYQNGLVTGDQVYWGENRSFLSEGDTPYAYTHFSFKNTDGKSLTVAADVSRYSDMTYQNQSAPLEGDLEEPSLTMRYLYYMKDAREMAAELTGKTFQGVWSNTQYEAVNQNNTDNAAEANWKETKVFHYPSKQLAYEKDKLVGYRGEFIGLRHIFSDYWIFNNSTPSYDPEHPTDNDGLNDHLISGSTPGSIVVKIYDPNGTGIRLGGYNPNINMKGETTWATPAAQVGDIIRVNISGKGTDFNPRFKYGNNYDDFWDLLAQINYDEAPEGYKYLYNSTNVTDNYFQATINSDDVLNSLISNGLRFQGVGFTITSVELIHNGVSTTIWGVGNQVFDGWGVRIDIASNKFAGVSTTNYNEGSDDEYQGFYYHDKMYPWNNAGLDQYGDSRFLVFRYPDGGVIPDGATNKPVYLRAYFVDPNDDTRIFQLAQYTIIFDRDEVKGEDFATLPWKSVNGSGSVQGSERDPNQLRAKAGKPIAQITFDYPTGTTYHFPEGYTNHGQNTHNGEDYGYERDEPYLYPDNAHTGFTGIIPDSSPIPLIFDKSNYAFDGENALFGAYAMLSKMDTEWGNQKDCLPADDATYGYGIAPDGGYQAGFLYIDASELPGDICSTPFVGDFCSGDKLMVSGWISGANNVKNGTGVPDRDGARSPGGITLTLKGEHNLHNTDGSIMYDDKGNPKKDTVTLYRFCPGMCYELDNGVGIDGNASADHVVWQQFYFEFKVEEKYERHWLEVNNNCVSSQGGDFMLDNIEVYAIVPEVEPEMNTPLCVNKDGTTEMRLLKLKVDYNKVKSSSGVNEGSATDAYLGFVFLDKKVFLETFKAQLGFDGSLEELAEKIEAGDYSTILHTDSRYQTAFNAALLREPGNTRIWASTDGNMDNKGAGVMYFQWKTNYNQMEEYSFEKAVNKQGAVFRYTDDNDEKFIIMNGNYPQLPWRTNTEYYILPSNAKIDNFSGVYAEFNLCSQCSRASTFLIEPPLTVLGLEKSEGTDDYVVCEGQIPTIVLDMKGYDLNGNVVDMTGLNFDWWLGDKANGVLATLDNYHNQNKSGVKLDAALAALRSYYPSITSLDGVIEHLDKTPNLSLAQVMYLKELVGAGQLVLHQSSISVPAEPTSAEDPYFYLVACPIHDASFDQALNPQANQYVAYFCDEPQGLRIKVGQKAPTMKTGFVPNEHGYTSYDYTFPENTDPVLSIRLAKAAQFETVKNEVAEAADGTLSETVNYLWLPIRNAKTETADRVIKKAQDDNIYLASTNDPTMDKKISNAMSKTGLLPIVGRIVQLTAINTKDNSEGALPTAPPINESEQNVNNRLCVYFIKGFDVREGYNYTLSLPFQEDGDVNTCNGTILINLKIVPDYEVWTGAAGNTDWNNDENWRRADGNTTITNDVYGDELYRKNGAEDNTNSPLHTYTTNKENYYSSNKANNAKPSSDQVLRKGFAPLYCTHILMSRDEWGNAPVLYDAIDGHDVVTGTSSKLINAPFPNLRDTSTPILKFDMQARKWSMWEETYGVAPDRGESSRPDDLIAEMYQINSCDEIAFQPGTELRNAHLLNYNNAWMEFELDAKRWYLLGSPLQGTISGEWYAPTGTAATGEAPLQKTTYYDDVKFGAGYDRYNPAIYQRSWDKAKAVLYEVGSEYGTNDDSQTENLGSEWAGSWNGNNVWQDPTGETDGTGADDYLDRLGYKPFGAKKANVAIKGVWSNTYNDAQVDYANGGFSVMVMNHLKGKPAEVKAIIRLPKEDTMYDYYEYSQDGDDNGGTDTDLATVQSAKNRAKNRGRLKTDLLLPTQDGIQKQEKEAVTYRYGDRRTYTRIPIKEDALETMNSGAFSFTEKVAAGASNLVYYLVENPFPCGLDMAKFFEANTDILEPKYWILTKGDNQNPRQQLVQQAGSEWVTSEGTSIGAFIEYPDPSSSTEDPKPDLKFYPDAVLAPGQGFFVQAKAVNAEGLTVTFNDDMQAQSRFGVIDGTGKTFTIVVGQAQKMRPLKKLIEIDTDNDGIPDTTIEDENSTEYETIDVDLNGNGIYGETGITIGEGDDAVTRDEKENVMVPVYETDNDGNYRLDDNGNKIPVLEDIESEVVIYKYKPETLTLADQSTVDKEYPLKGRTRGGEANLAGLVITAQRGSDKTSALVMQREEASDDFLPSEDTEVFITSDFESVPTVYTLCGRLATTINSIHEFRSLPLGVESNSDAPCTLTFKGVEALGDSVAFYDALEQTLTPLESGMQVSVSGQTRNRYYLVRSLSKEEAAAETHIQIFTEGLTAKVVASTAEPIVSVRCFDTAGRLIHSASPQSTEYSFTLPISGVYIIEAETENDRKTKKLMAR